MAQRGQGSGHPLGYSWDAYLSDLVHRHGSLVAIATMLAEERHYQEDIASIERALRRLRQRGMLAGGLWGTRLVKRFGLPRTVAERLAWMGMYHSRFNDLPVLIARELLLPWEQGPLVDEPEARAWLALAHTSLAIRSNDLATAWEHAERARRDERGVDIAIERRLVFAWLASRNDRSLVPGLLDEIVERMALVAHDDTRICFFARWIDHRAYAIHHSSKPDYPFTETLYREIPEQGPPFACARRANGLAWTIWKQGRVEEAAASAWAAARHAGDGGHVRLRAMALAMVARITGDLEAAQRNRAIVAALDDELLRIRGAGRRI